MEKTANFPHKALKFLMAFVMMLSIGASFMVAPNMASADNRIGSTGNSSSDGSQGRLRSSVDSAIADKSYISQTGDTIRGTELVKNGITTDRFVELTSKEQQKLINDMSSAVSKQQAKDKENNTTNPVTQDTATNWLKELQQRPGVGAKLLGNITEQLKPDYVKGNRIFQPFAGPINTAIALMVIALMFFLVMTFAIDLAFLNVPMFQAWVTSAGEGGNGGRKGNFFVSREAMQSLEESENGSNGKSKNQNGIYIKKRFIGMFLLGICLLYLIQGQIMILVGMLMDLLAGFLE
ncbi:hypothetical protein P4493_04440 [Bacillus thuringiensis]|uniref:Uncharacterized protein n=4 Tax=Bacillus thuringiensis TaxID=1428 RepID=A0AB33AQI3_BACTU|nr:MULTISPECIES: hypothetical protein [Bacillus]EAO56989.1 hypothetical protein RBTH_07732 [Bacillus thuringiensis serovar israelensis ATCC 35646]MEC2534459.1 hypothetical protein [Bacillus cereus]MED1153760.1 hypothetical protein [Bacillus paranthracis]AFQ30074.1 hypothetical protein BTF1_29867 [Bacillus thuringiensis HD-789]AJG74019.1 hypothetical protein BF38_5874 [Bacillus thuringiensis]